jgi:glucose/arabinose dehydrogenase
MWSKFFLVTGAAGLARLALAAGVPPPELPAPFATPSAAKHSKVVGWPADGAPKPLQNFRVAAFARDLKQPRWLLVLPNGDVLVAESDAGRITLLRDAHKEGKASEKYTLIEGLNKPFGLALRRDRLYVGNTDAVLACPYLVGQTAVRGSCKKVMDLPHAPGGHWMRDILFTPDESRMYVSVGSETNIDEEGIDAKEPHRATILVANPDGSDAQVYASGLRNPVGLAFEPETMRLWTVVNERDGLGDDLPPDYMTAVKQGGFYGWPYSYFGGHADPRKPGQHPELVAKALTPDFWFPPHAAPLGLVFYQRDAFAKQYRGGAFIAEHGSWNRSEFHGYRVVFVPFAHGKPAGPAEDFLTGFIKDEATSEVYGRPVGLAVANDGALLVADDGGNVIWRVWYKCSACTPDPEPAGRH